jgi:DNA-3-methyladenine glycosylase II
VRPFYRAVEKDRLLGPTVRASRGLRVAGYPDLFEAITTIVISQQINLRFAYSVRDELVSVFGGRARLGGATYRSFPSPRRVARAPLSSLLELRLSRAKAETILRVAGAFGAGELSESALASLPDEEVIERLISIKGVGRWTAETVLLRGLGRLDAFPAGDLGVVKYLAQGLLGRRAPATEAEMRAHAERWRPYRGLALVYAYAELARRQDEERLG